MWNLIFGHNRTDFTTCDGPVSPILRCIDFVRQFETPLTEIQLHRWMCQHKENNIPVTVDMICDKAKEIHSALNESIDFMISPSWVQSFARRYKIELEEIEDEQIEQFSPTYIPAYRFAAEQIYKVHETTLFWRKLPDKGTPLQQISEHDRLVVLNCANSNGNHKLKPFITGPLIDPDYFEIFNDSVIYIAKDDYLKTQQIFNEWFFKHFVDEVFENLRKKGLRLRVLLLFETSVQYYPPTDQIMTTGSYVRIGKLLITQNDWTLTDLTRLEYKKFLLRKVIENDCKTIPLQDAVSIIQDIWDNTTPSAIRSSFNAIAYDTDGFTAEECCHLGLLKSNILAEKCSRLDIRTLLNRIYGFGAISDLEVDSWLSDEYPDDDKKQGPGGV